MADRIETVLRTPYGSARVVIGSGRPDVEVEPELADEIARAGFADVTGWSSRHAPGYIEDVTGMSVGACAATAALALGVALADGSARRVPVVGGPGW